MIIYILYFYLITGLFYAIYFIFWRMIHIDENSRQTSIFFKLIILPGVVLLWSFLFVRYNIRNKL